MSRAQGISSLLGLLFLAAAFAVVVGGCGEESVPLVEAGEQVTLKVSGMT